MMPDETESARPSRVWTPRRLALAALAFALVAAAASPGCNPTDGSANLSTANAPGAKSATQATPPLSSAGPRRPRTERSDALDPEPRPLPELVSAARMTDLGGKALSLSDYQGKVVVLNVWATWCGPCRREIPDFIAMNADYKGRELAIIGVTMEDERNTEEQVKNFVKGYKVDYPIAWVDLETYKALLEPGYQIPQTYILDRQGRQVYKFVGYAAAERVRGIIDQALEAK